MVANALFSTNRLHECLYADKNQGGLFIQSITSSAVGRVPTSDIKYIPHIALIFRSVN